MEETSAQHTKVSDSAYFNSCSNSQSQRSTRSSKSRRSNSSESSGYCGGTPLILGPSNAALPLPISKRKDKEHKKKKTRPAMEIPGETEVSVENASESTHETDVCAFSEDVSHREESQKTVEVGVVELMDATDPGEHNATAEGSLDPTTSTCPMNDDAAQANEGFCALISMQDGVVLYTTPSLSSAWGYPKDYWIGRSFIDFVHSKDRHLLISQITNTVTAMHADNPKANSKHASSLFCRIRSYQSANCNKNEKPVRYLPFLVNLTYGDFREHSPVERAETMFLVATAQPVVSAYKAPEEMIISAKFTTRHTASCHFSYCDPDVVRYFGYLPQDMVGRSLFEFYHPEDLPFIKEIYETVVKLGGRSLRSKPYRFALQNGDYLVLETEWSSFVNPWSRKLEFVVGHHRVLKGPGNPHIFQPPDDAKTNTLADISKEVLKESKIIQEEIQALLNETIPARPDETSDRFNDLVPFAETLLTKTKMLELNIHVPAERSFSEHDSVMLGEISPHHEYSDNKSSTETPPSYNHLNYNEKIERYFKSNPLTTTMYESEEGNANLPSSADDEYSDSKSSGESPLSYNQLNYNEKIHRYFNSNPLTTTIYGSEESNANVRSSTDDEDLRHKSKRPPSSAPRRKCSSPENRIEVTGSGSAGDLSSGCNNQTSSASRGDTCNTTETARFKLPTLTESVLTKHNEATEKLMFQRHRDMRSAIKNSDKLKSSTKKTNETSGSRSQSHKRKGSTSLSRKDNCAKKPRQADGTGTNTRVQDTRTDNVNATHGSGMLQRNAGVNFWPSYSIRPSGIQPPEVSASTQNISTQVKLTYPGVGHVIPIYYAPTQQNRSRIVPSNVPQEHPGPPSKTPTDPRNHYIDWVAPGIQGVMYPTVLAAQPSIATLYQPFMLPEFIPPMQTIRETSQSVGNTSEKPFASNRPSSQATSVKAEPGSIMAMSECSKKHCQAFSSCRYRHGSNLLNVHLLTPHLGSCYNCGVAKTLSQCFNNVKVLSPGELCSPCVSLDEDCSSETRESASKKAKQERPPEYNEDESSYSSLYSSFLNKSSDSSCQLDQKKRRDRLREDALEQQAVFSNNDKQRHLRRKDPPWLEGVTLTPDLIYKYQLIPKELDDVLRADKNVMKKFIQPPLVNTQLNQLYWDLEAGDFDNKLIIADSPSYSESEKSACSNDEEADANIKHKTKLTGCADILWTTVDYSRGESSGSSSTNCGDCQ